MTYRTAPTEPLIVCMGRGLLALEPGSGRVLWSATTEAAITRLFRVGERVLALAGSKVHCLDRDTGAAIGVVDVGFFPDEGIVCGQDLALVHGRALMQNRPSMVCLTSDGALRWRATCSFESKGILDGQVLLRSYDADGSVVSEARYPIASESPGFLYQGVVVQPDRR